jgi:hypothetical protein
MEVVNRNEKLINNMIAVFVKQMNMKIYKISFNIFLGNE